MYNASKAFHDAIEEGRPQKALLIFSNAVFTNDDIDVSRGIEFSDFFNLEEDFAIGQAPSNELNFTLFNDAGYLHSYKFGDFLATIGVLISETVYQQIDGVKVITNNATWTGYNIPPFLRRNGTAVSAQPSFAVTALLGYNNKLYAFSEEGACVIYNDKTGANITNTEPKVNSFMKNKAKGWAGKGFYYSNTTRLLNIYDTGIQQVYEFCPLGYFSAERPKAPDTILIDMNCYDYMVKFDDDMPSNGELGVSYPVTLGNLLKKICDYAGVDCKSTKFINSTATLTERPKEFDNATMRDVIKWIAEAAAGNARIDRDGKLVIDWIRRTDITLTANNYETFDPYWYKTKKITKVYNRASDGSFESVSGTGKEAYLIQDNPILKGVS